MTRQESDERSKKLITDFDIATGFFYCSNFWLNKAVKNDGSTEQGY